MNAPAKIAAQIASEIGKPENAPMIERQLVQEGRHSRALARFAAVSALEDETGCCSYCEGRGTVPPAGNRPYFDREEVLCVECDGKGEA